MTIGDVLKSYRKKHKMSQDKFVAKSGISKGYISMLENNTNARDGKPIQPTIEMFRKLAFGMDIELDELLRIIDGDQKISLSADYDKKETSKYSPLLNIILTKAQHLNTKGLKELEKHTDLLLLSEEYRRDEAEKCVEELPHLPKYVKEGASNIVNAAHSIDGASEDDKQFDEKIMDDKNF